MADIKRLLRKKNPTGRELGILELTNMSVTYREALEGKEPQPLFDRDRFLAMASALPDSQLEIYNGYIAVHEWLAIRYNMAQTQMQQAQFNFKTLSEYVTDAILGEDVYSYIDQLPAIMTQKQYDDIKAAGVEAYMKDSQGNENFSDVFDLIERAILYYLHQLQREPRKSNPLKAIRKKYLTEPLTSPIILNHWNDRQKHGGYYSIDDLDLRSDQMSQRKWEDVLRTPALNNAMWTVLHTMKLTDGDGVEFTAQEAEERIIDKAKVFFAHEDRATVQHQNEIKPPITWHYYDQAPKDLTKWDVIEQELLLDFYPADLDGSGNRRSTSNYIASMRDFTTEFSELVQAMLDDMDTRYFDPENGVSKVALSEWQTTGFTYRELYEKDFYCTREEASEDITAFEKNRRALLNGIAIIRPSDLGNASIDRRGYYVEPDLSQILSNITLELFFPEAKDREERIDQIHDTRETLLESYYFVKGYNTAIDMICETYDVPDFSVFKMDLLDLEDRMDTLKQLIVVLHRKIYDIDYEDKDLQNKKLQVLKDLFQPIDYHELVIPKDKLEEATRLMEGFVGFKPENAAYFDSLLCTLPHELREDTREDI